MLHPLRNEKKVLTLQRFSEERFGLAIVKQIYTQGPQKCAMHNGGQTGNENEIRRRSCKGTRWGGANPSVPAQSFQVSKIITLWRASFEALFLHISASRRQNRKTKNNVTRLYPANYVVFFVTHAGVMAACYGVAICAIMCACAFIYIFIIAYRDTLSRQFVGEVERGAFHIVCHVCVSLKSGGSGRVAGHA